MIMIYTRYTHTDAHALAHTHTRSLTFFFINILWLCVFFPHQVLQGSYSARIGMNAQGGCSQFRSGALTGATVKLYLRFVWLFYDWWCHLFLSRSRFPLLKNIDWSLWSSKFRLMFVYILLAVHISGVKSECFWADLAHVDWLIISLHGCLNHIFLVIEISFSVSI